MSNWRYDPQTHQGADPVNEPDTQDDPVRDADEDEGWGGRGRGHPAGTGHRHVGRLSTLAVVSALALSACGLSVPTDPSGTLDTIRRSGVLHAGASPRDGWVAVTGDGPPTGREAELMAAYAEHLGAEVEWTVAGEEELVGLLDEGDLDVAVGGFTEKNAWVDEVGLTRPYTGTHVVMVRLGENALQSDLERWLDSFDPDGGDES